MLNGSKWLAFDNQNVYTPKYDKNKTYMHGYMVYIHLDKICVSDFTEYAHVLYYFKCVSILKYYMHTSNF